MKVKLKQDSHMGIKKGTEFEVVGQDSGDWSNDSFYSGWVEDESGHKMYLSFEQDKCEVVNWN